jgi:DNA-binding GntR family transcriptional regulator
MVLDQEALAVAHGLSTTPVREALNRLESEGLVVNRPHRRTVVAPMSRTLVQETYRVRLSLDPLAAGLTAEHASEFDVADIFELASRAPEADPVHALHANRKLHQAIYWACGNPVLAQILDMLYDRSDRYRMMTLKAAGTIGLAHDEHLSIALAIKERDAEKAAALMHQHTATSLNRIQAAPLGSS